MHNLYKFVSALIYLLSFIYVHCVSVWRWKVKLLHCSRRSAALRMAFSNYWRKTLYARCVILQVAHIRIPISYIPHNFQLMSNEFVNKILIRSFFLSLPFLFRWVDQSVLLLDSFNKSFHLSSIYFAIVRCEFDAKHKQSARNWLIEFRMGDLYDSIIKYIIFTNAFSEKLISSANEVSEIVDIIECFDPFASAQHTFGVLV